MPAERTFEMLDVEKLVMDIDNPRIARIIEQYGSKPSAEQINLALGVGTGGEESNGPTFQALKESIKTHGGVIHPIIVNRTPKKKLVVIEGNTRVAIYKEFLEQKVKGQWKTMPAVVYDNLSDTEIDAIRLQSHLVGPRPWDPYSKAKYLNFLSTTQRLSINAIVDFCGGRGDEVRKYIDAYNDMEKYYRKVLKDDSEFDTSRFSAFVELQNPRIKRGILTAGYALTHFAKWVHERLVYPLTTVRDLPRILANKESRAIFLKDGAKEAVKVLWKGEPGDVKNLDMDSLARALIDRLRSITFQEVRELRSNPDSERARNLLELLEELQETCNEIKEA
jgi:hypothetical protein